VTTCDNPGQSGNKTCEPSCVFQSP
jgi:hypothetical protein